MESSFVETLVGAAGIPLICWTILSNKKNAESFPIMGVIFGFLIIVILFITASGTKERIKHEYQSYEGLIQTLLSFFKFKEFRIVIGKFLFNICSLC
jgi:Na+/melibiose symporter-like transporter